MGAVPCLELEGVFHQEFCSCEQHKAACSGRSNQMGVCYQDVVESTETWQQKQRHMGWCNMGVEIFSNDGLQPVNTA
jgi:hypothetical protein